MGIVQSIPMESTNYPDIMDNILIYIQQDATLHSLF